MAAPKGNKFSKGRPKGSKNVATAKVREVFLELLAGRIDSVGEWIDMAAAKDPKDGVDCLLKLAEYCIPKLARVENTGEDGGPLVVKWLDGKRSDDSV